MRISSKAILNPGPSGVRTPVNPLAPSLSRRLRHSGSVRGGASPAMFTTTAKKRGSFDNPEPSSPKVTCIGQVRIRSKKKHKKVRTLSRRRSFRGLDHPVNGFPSKRHKHKESSNLGPNQECSSVQRKWVHFPVTICDSLRAFGSEFSCLFPCRREEKTVVGDDGRRKGSCGAVPGGDGGGGGRDIELVVGDEDQIEQQDEEVVKKSRRHVFEDLEIVNDRIEGHDEDEARVRICVPPKNALLLMRCRSDPMKIEALTIRSWEPNVGKTIEEDEVVDIEDQIEENLGKPVENLEVELKQVMILDQNQENIQQDEANQDQEHDIVQEDELIDIEDQTEEDLGKPMGHLEVEQKQVMILDQNQENFQQDEANQDQEHDIMQEDEANQYKKHDNVQQDETDQEQEQSNLQQDEANQHQEYKLYNQTEEESFYLVSLFEETTNQDYKIQQDEAHEEEEEEDDTQIAAEDSKLTTEFAEISETHEEQMLNVSSEHNNGVLKESEKLLPECLLMMMYEPKLSMEVSKETWVCREDFTQRHRNRRKPPPPPPPPLPAIKPDGGDESTATVNDVLRASDGGLPAALRQPARSSCSLPAASMAVVLEQKLVNAVAYEPFVLTRCKSEPMKSAAAKLQPESCVLENRKSERLSRVALSVGAAGLGF